jgi:alpha-tubulin suppressor-like RCC1 family protein
MNILLVDKRVSQYEDIVAAIDPALAVGVVFDYFEDTFDTVKARMSALGLTHSTGFSVGLIQHNYRAPMFSMLASAELAPVSSVATRDPELARWAQFRDFVAWCKTEFSVAHFDMMACALYSDPDWKYVIDTLATQTGVTIRASTDNTGAAALGGDWFLESHTGVNLKGVYFTSAIEAYKGILQNSYELRKYSTKGVATGSVITWGTSDFGGTTPEGVSSDVVAVYSTEAAFAALKTDGSVITWGEPNRGGNSSVVTYNAGWNYVSVEDKLISGVVAVYSTQNSAFAALKTDGSVVAWGDSREGGNSNYPISNVDRLSSGVVAVYSTHYGFAALKSDGSVVAWGEPEYGGGDSNYPNSNGSSLDSGVLAVYSNNEAFAALKTDGSVITWGYPESGGDSSAVSADLTSGVVSIYSAAYAFAALKNDGSIVVWGVSAFGGNDPGITSGVVAVYSTLYAFAALKSDGSIVAWGDSANGGTTPANVSSGVVAAYSTENAFAALKTDGSVVAWGDSANGGTTPANVSSDVVSIYSSGLAFAALKTDGSVIAWGDSYSGGDSSLVASSLLSGVVAVYSTHEAFAALKSDGSVVAWGYGPYGGTTPGTVSSDVVSIYSNYYAFAALKTTATTFDLSFSYYSNMDRYDILRKKENRRRVDLTTNNIVFELSTARELQSFNPTIPANKALHIVVPDYVSSPLSITSTASIPETPDDFIVACDEGEPVTIFGTTYVNYGSYVYIRETDNTYTKTTSATINTTPYALYGGDGTNSSGIAFVVTGSPLPLPCFLEGSTILCQVRGVDQYVPVEHLTTGTLVKTNLNGYKPVVLTGHGVIENPGDDARTKNRLYKCSVSNYPELAHDLYLTGGHSILESHITDVQKEALIGHLGRIFITDDKYRLIACVDERAEPWVSKGVYTIWHVALENDNESRNYGVYANGGLLVESCSIHYLKTKSNMILSSK